MYKLYGTYIGMIDNLEQKGSNYFVLSIPTGNVIGRTFGIKTNIPLKNLSKPVAKLTYETMNKDIKRNCELASLIEEGNDRNKKTVVNGKRLSLNDGHFKSDDNYTY